MSSGLPSMDKLSPAICESGRRPGRELISPLCAQVSQAPLESGPALTLPSAAFGKKQSIVTSVSPSARMAGESAPKAGVVMEGNQVPQVPGRSEEETLHVGSLQFQTHGDK